MGSLRKPSHSRQISGLLLVMFLAEGASILGDEPGQLPDQQVPNLAVAQDALMGGEYERAIEVYSKLMDDPETAPAAAIGVARCRMRIGDYEEGIAGLEAEPAPDSAEWHLVLAKLLRLVGRYDEGLEHVRAAVRLDPGHPGSRLLVGSMLEALGRRDDAIESYRWFDQQLRKRSGLPRDAEWVTDTAVGFLRYTVLTESDQLVPRTRHVLHEMLQMVYERVDRTWWPARIAAADLLRERFNNDPLDGSVADYEAALLVSSNLPEAHVGLGEVALHRWDFDEAERRAELALEVNPHYPPAIHLLAKERLLERRYAEAAQVCDRALSFNTRDVVALSLSAAAAACRYDDAEVARARARVAKINPRSAVYHRILGDALAGIRQYAAAEAEYQKAIEYEPTDANAHTELGLTYMQWGLEDKAHKVLDRAWELDPFNDRTLNTVKLLESLESFARLETPHFTIRSDPQRDPGLAEYMAEYLESIYATITGDYETTLSDKTIIEVFPTQSDFGVRITGKPWIHTVGACTGRVIAMSSPRGSTQLFGPYDYARVLRHEFTHTVTLAATQNRIPHWFTEALAVSQEESPRSYEWCALLARAIRRNELFTLESIDWGFIRPRRPHDRTVAYAQSEWMYEYIVERFGYDTINAMLRRYRLGQTSEQVFKEQMAVTPTEFDRDFAQWARQRATPWGFDMEPPEDASALRTLAEKEPDDSVVQGRLARAELDDGDPERALAAARRALELNENERAGLEVLLTVLSGYFLENLSEPVRRGYEKEARLAATRLTAVDPDSTLAAEVLGTLALSSRDWEEAIVSFERLQRIRPMNPASWQGLAGIYLERGEDDLALSQLLELVRLGEADPEIPAHIAGIYRRRGELRESRYWYVRALRVNPFSVKVHDGLGDTEMQLGNTKAALREYVMSTRIEPKKAGHFEKAAFAAAKIGDERTAQDLARQAVALDPDSAARTLVP